MQWVIPGTTLAGNCTDADRTDERFQALFLAGGLTLSQVSSVTGLESYTVQNWVRRGFLAPPRNKRYTMEQVCRLINLNILKGVMPLEQIIRLMAYLNSGLTDERGCQVDDAMLFFLFVKLAARTRSTGGTQTWDEALLQVTEGYKEPAPGAREKLIRVLKIMLTVWAAGRLKAEAEIMLAQLGTETAPSGRSPSQR